VTRLDTFSDPLAAQLLGPPFPHLERGAKAVFRQLPWLPRLLHRVSLGMGDLFALRSEKLDELLGAEQPQQLVILGAGLDSRAFRELGMQQTVVFEVDRPSALAYKQARVGSRRPTVRSLRFIGLDLTGEELGAALEAAGHRADVPTFWLAEGLLMYLTGPELRRVLNEVADRSHPGSQLAATYVALGNAGAVMAWVASHLREPFRSGMNGSQLALLLTEAGFDVRGDHALLDGRLERWETSWFARSERVLLGTRRAAGTERRAP